MHRTEVDSMMLNIYQLTVSKNKNWVSLPLHVIGKLTLPPALLNLHWDRKCSSIRSD